MTIEGFECYETQNTGKPVLCKKENITGENLTRVSIVRNKEYTNNANYFDKCDTNWQTIIQIGENDMTNNPTNTNLNKRRTAG